MVTGSPLARGRRSTQNRPLGETGGLGPFAGIDLLAAVGLNAGHLDAPVGANHGDAVVLDSDDLAELAGDPLRVLGRQRRYVEYLDRLAVERRPGARRRTAAADERVDLTPGFAPVDARIARAAEAPR